MLARKVHYLRQVYTADRSGERTYGKWVQYWKAGDGKRRSVPSINGTLCFAGAVYRAPTGGGDFCLFNEL